MVDLGTLGGSSGTALAMSASGQVVGYSDVAGNAASHAFSWTPANGITDLGTLSGSASTALAVNASGQVVGYSDTPAGRAPHTYARTPSGGTSHLRRNSTGTRAAPAAAPPAWS